MTNKEIKEYLNCLGSVLPNIPVEWLEKHAPKLDEDFNKRRVSYDYQVLYEFKDVCFTIEIKYYYNDLLKPIIMSQNIYGAKYKNTYWKNAYWVMGIGYRARNEIKFSQVYKWAGNSEYIFYYSSVFKGRNYIRRLHNLYDDKAQTETLYKLGMVNLINYCVCESNKPIVALGLDKFMSKSKFNEFLIWVKQFKTFKLDLYRDFLKMAKRHNHKEVFITDWIKLHDKWAGIVKQKENEKIYKKDLKVWNEIDKYETIKITQMKSTKEMRQFGKDMNNCLQKNNFEYKHIYKVECLSTVTPLAMYFKNDRIIQLYGYKNKHVNDHVKSLVMQVIQAPHPHKKPI